MEISARERVIVALDVSTEDEALHLVDELRNHVGMFKIGLELLTSEGKEIVKRIADQGVKVFYDGKFNDIPNTVARAARGASRLGVRMFNVHTMGGTAMMESALKATKEEASACDAERPWVLGVTILTSVDQTIMNQEMRILGKVEDQVIHLAKLADKAGLDGVIASPLEIEAVLGAMTRQMLVVTPGVRPSWASVDDQKRVMSPGEAVFKGASYVVIGRPITRPPTKIGTSVDAAKLIEEEIAANI